MFVMIAFVITLLLGVPMAFVLGITAVTHIITMGDPRFLNIVVQRMFGGVNSFNLMCIPFFVLAGELMNYSGFTEKIVAFVRECVGMFRGGMAYVAIIVAAFLSAILGSANAVAAILCTAIVPELVKDKYDKAFSAALIAASGVLGPTIPPSMGFILMGVLTGASVNRLFMSGVIPGIVIALGYMVIIFVYAKRRNYPKVRNEFGFKDFLKKFFIAFPSLLVPGIIVGGILFGVFTPTESGAVAVGIALLGGIIYRSLKWSDFPKILFNTAIVTSSIMLIVSCGNIIGWTLAIDQIPKKLTESILGFTTNPSAVMLLILLLLTGIGCVMDGFAAMIIFAPVFAPLATSVGFDLVHFSLIFAIMISIGLITPPVGMVLFVTSNITEVPLRKINRAIVPFFIVAFAVTFIMAFLPQITLFLPNLLIK